MQFTGNTVCHIHQAAVHTAAVHIQDLSHHHTAPAAGIYRPSGTVISPAPNIVMCITEEMFRIMSIPIMTWMISVEVQRVRFSAVFL